MSKLEKYKFPNPKGRKAFTAAQRYVFNKQCSAAMGIQLFDSVYKDERDLFLDAPVNWSDDEHRTLYNPFEDLNQLADVVESLMAKHNENLTVHYSEGTMMEIMQAFVIKFI